MSETEVLEEVPVFNPTEEEFSDTLSYIYQAWVTELSRMESVVLFLHLHGNLHKAANQFVFLRLSVGMCLSSQFWESEKERLYSLCYLHVGAPRVWYSVAGCHRSKFKAAMKSFIPEMSEEQPKKSHDPVMIMSPYQLSMEGSYYSAFDTGFNCLEKADFAPLDWLPHGDIAVQLNQEKSKKSLTSYDKLLLSAAREAVKCLKEYALSKKNTACYMRWNDSCGTDGLFSNIVKSRIKQEKNRLEFLSNSLESQRMDKSVMML
ncbi:unnamed protein product [Arabidopsis halleri]